MPQATGLLLDSIGLLYDSLIYPERRNDFLALLRVQLNCDTAAIALHDLDNHTPAIQFALGIPERLIEEWNGSYGRKNPRAPEIRRQVLRTGAWFHATSICKMSVAFREDPYVHWLQRNDLYHSMVLAVRSGTAVTSMNLTRCESAVPFETGAKKLIRQLIPHLQRTLQIQSHNDGLRTLCEGEKFALDKIDTAVIGIDEQQNVVLTNRSADAILSSGRVLSVRGGKLVTTQFCQAAAFERLLQSAAQTSRAGSESSGGVMTIRDEQLAPISVIVSPFLFSCVLAGKRSCTLVFVVDQAAKPMSRAGLLRDVFGLSPAECRLSELLHQGLDLNAAADRLGVTTETARFMLKRIFAKTGSHRQSHLLQLLSRLPGQR